jgi:ribonuclease Z
MKVTILGSSSALPTSGRYPSAHVLNAHERLFLIDCGEGTQMQLRRTKIRFSKINNIFITHLHGDHLFGLYGLLSTFSLMGREAPLHLYAPEKYEQILASHLSDFDINLSFKIEFKGLSGKDPVEILNDKYLTVTAFPLQHRVPAFGFLFREKNSERNILSEKIEEYKIPPVRIRAIKKGEDFVTDDGSLIPNSELTSAPADPLSYAYCSDTRYFKRLSSFVKNVTLLYHEATFDSSKYELAKMTGHSTTFDAAKTASDANAGALLIGHFSSRYKDINPLVEESRTIFKNTNAAIDGQTIDIGNLVSKKE